MNNKIRLTLLLLISFSILTGILKGQDAKPVVSAEDLAKKLSNPVAALISVPFQNNMDIGIMQFFIIDKAVAKGPMKAQFGKFAFVGDRMCIGSDCEILK